MDRYSRKIKEKDTAGLADFIFENAMGSIVVFDHEPTASEIKANTMVKFGNNLYLKTADGNAVKLTGTALS